MKKHMLTIIALLIATSAFSQKEVNGCIVTLENSATGELTKKNDTITVDFVPSEYFWNVKVTNNLKQDISIVWEKSTFIENSESSRIVFGTTTRMTKDNPIQNEEVPSESFISKRILPVENIMSSGVYPTISKKFIKSRFEKTGLPEKRKIILAVLVGEDIKKFEYNFSVVLKPKK